MARAVVIIIANGESNIRFCKIKRLTAVSNAHSNCIDRLFEEITSVIEEAKPSFLALPDTLDKDKASAAFDREVAKQMPLYHEMATIKVKDSKPRCQSAKASA